VGLNDAPRNRQARDSAASMPAMVARTSFMRWRIGSDSHGSEI
jgi:hypothetical protein